MKITQRKFIFVGNGPQDGFWKSEYLLCPYCNVLLEKNSKISRCKCGNISIDGDAFRISVKVDDTEIPTFNEIKTSSDESISFEQITKAKYVTKIKPKSTYIEKIDVIGVNGLLVLENCVNYSGISNLYLLKNKKEIFMQLPNSEDYYIDFSDFGQSFIEASSLRGMHCKIDLKTGKCLECDLNP